MSSKKNERKGSPQVHRERLSTLIKALKVTKGKIKYDGIDYDLQGITSKLNYKSFIQDVTGMSEGAFNKYESPEIEKNTAYSNLGKVLKEPGDFIHAIRPYLTIDIGRETRINSLFEDEALDIKHNKPDEPKNGSIVTLSHLYHIHFQKAIIQLSSFIVSDTNKLQFYSELGLKFEKYIKKIISNQDSILYSNGTKADLLVNILKSRYLDILNSNVPPESILPGYDIANQPISEYNIRQKYRLKFNRNIHSLNFLDIPYDVQIDYRYELLWEAHYDNYEFESWPESLKIIMLLVSLEELLMKGFYNAQMTYLIQSTKFIIESSSDGVKPIYIHRELSYSDLFTILTEYQLDDLEENFKNNLVNLINHPIYRKPVIERSMTYPTKPMIEFHIITYLSFLYTEKIKNDITSISISDIRFNFLELLKDL